MTTKATDQAGADATMAIEIDRDRLRTYLCSDALNLIALMAGIMLGVQIGIILINLATEPFTSWVTLGAGWIFLILAVVIYVCGIAIYFLRLRGLAIREADRESLSVEGPFLHIRRIIGKAGGGRGFSNGERQLQDLKLHFRAIVSYGVFQDFAMRRHGIHALQLISTSHGMRNEFLIRGIMDCEKARDMLAEMGEQRAKSMNHVG